MAEDFDNQELSGDNQGDNTELNVTGKRARKRLSFPITPFEDSFEYAKKLYEIGSGDKVRRMTFFKEWGRSPDSSASRMMIVNSNKYDLTKGGYSAEFLELTELGYKAVSHTNSLDSYRAKFNLAISQIEVYKYLYNKYINVKVPNKNIAIDVIKEKFPDLTNENSSIVFETFIVNLKYLGLIQTISGAERILSVEEFIEQSGNSSFSTVSSIAETRYTENNSVKDLSTFKSDNDFHSTCFYISPIGAEDTEYRKHSDLFLESIIRPALVEFGLNVIRADQIEKPGIISNQVIENIFKSKLVIADLSFHNPNVFYELALRHVSRLPTVQIIRKNDQIPFDLSHTRTIIIDTTDIYTLVPKLESYKVEIASQVRQVLANKDSSENPITNVLPDIKLILESQNAK
ncbi:MAG: hypothetical protein IM638_17820 [Bacteroidetes bacterium]|nr:hypothetical protein [Bacteroidota bacterium]